MKATLSPLPAHILDKLKFSDEEASYGSLQTAKGHLPLRRLEVDGRITGLIYRLTLSQTFVNAYPEPLEATYIFPLPLRAGVTRFVMKVQDRTIEGVLKEREQAREIYDAAIRAGHRAAIAEEDRPEVFTMRAGNIGPGESVTVELEMAGPLSFADQQAMFRFPLVIAPRYIPGSPLEGASVGSGTAVDTDAVPDASRITPPVLLPGQPNPVRLGLRLEVDPAGLHFEELSCSLHQMQMSQEGGVWVLSLEPGTERLDRDFILRIATRQDSVQTALSTVLDPEHEEGTFALTVVPPSLASAGVRPRDVVLLLDRSGSMEGWKMLAARRAASRIIDCLTPDDRFGVILFDDRLEEPAPSAGQLVNATDRARYKAVEFMARVEARGGTEISPALTRSLEYLAHSDPGRERIIVFVTDGQVGNEDQLLRQVQNQAQKCRIFSIGIDRCVNAGLLERLASYGGGAFELVESEDRLDEVLLNVHRRIGAPVVKDLKLGHPTWDVTPQPADLFPGVPARLFGRFRGTLPEKLTVTGTAADGSAWTHSVTPVATRDSAARTLWARARVLDMEHEFMAGHQDAGVAQKITQFSLLYHVLCRFTAFVAVDKTEVVNPGGQQHQVTQAVEPASGWDMLKQERAEGGIFQSSSHVLKCKQAPLAADPFGAPAGACFEAPCAPEAMALEECCMDLDMECFDLAMELPPPPPPACAPGPAVRKSAKTGELAPAPQKKRQAAPDSERLTEQVDKLSRQLEGGTPDWDLVEALLAEILVLLEQAGVKSDLLEAGRKLQRALRVAGVAEQSGLVDWLSLVRQDRGLPAAPPPAPSRGSWWKR